MTKYGVMVAVLGMVACGGESAPTADPVSRSAAVDGCTTDCERQIDCGVELALETCVDFCADHAAGRQRADYFDGWVECREAAACGDTTACEVCEPTPDHRIFETRCRAKFSSCGFDTEALDGICVHGQSSRYELCELSVDILREMTACMTGDCAQAANCLDRVSADHGL